MWISLTKADETKTAIDFDKVSHFSDHPNGTQIVLNTSVPGKDNGAPTPLILYVKEHIDLIAGILRAKKARR
jgi:hypothetical protein